MHRVHGEHKVLAGLVKHTVRTLESTWRTGEHEVLAGLVKHTVSALESTQSTWTRSTGLVKHTVRVLESTQSTWRTGLVKHTVRARGVCHSKMSKLLVVSNKHR